MNDIKEKARSTGPYLIVSAALIIGVLIAAGTLSSRWKSGSVITVYGLGTRDFVSDLVVWTASFSRKGLDLKAAYADLDRDKEAIHRYLLSKGVEEKEIVFSSVSINREYVQINGAPGTEKTRFAGFRLTRNASIESKDVEKIEAVSRSVSELINVGVELTSENPKFFYTKLADLKLEMIAMAADDGRRRAEAVAQKSKAGLGKLKLATTDVFQITAKYSSDAYTYGGVFDTSSKVKTATITIKIQYLID
jgi:uncharacterized protein